MNPTAYFLLFLATIVGFFGPGFQDIGLFVILHPTLLLIFYRWTYEGPNRTKTIVGAIFNRAIFPVLSLIVAGTVAFAGTYNDPDWKISKIANVLIINVVVGVVVGITCYLASARFQDRFDAAQWFKSMVFAIFYTTIYFVSSIGSPIGGFGNPALSLRNYPDLVQLISILGTDSLVFVIGWGASVIADWVVACMIERADPNEEDSTAEGFVKTLEGVWKRFQAAIVSFIVVFCLILTFGSLVGHDIPHTFYQKTFDKYMPNVVRGACIVSQNDMSAHDLFSLTAEQAAMDRELILWSETAVNVNSKEMEAELQANASAMADSLDIYLGVTYKTTYSGQHRNMFELYNPSGANIIDYQKRHPLPGAEDNTEAGTSNLPTAKTTWGTVAAGISFDLDFPDYVKTAGQKGAKILLEPSWTWGPIAEYQFFDHGYRAVENGVVLFRCSSQGYSGVIDSRYHVQSMRPAGSHAAFPVDIPLDDRDFVIYPKGGYVFAWVVLGLAGVLWILVCLPDAALAYMMAHFPKWFTAMFPFSRSPEDAVHTFDEAEDAAVVFSPNPELQLTSTIVNQQQGSYHSASQPPMLSQIPTSGGAHHQHQQSYHDPAYDDYYDHDSEDGGAPLPPDMEEA